MIHRFKFTALWNHTKFLEDSSKYRTKCPKYIKPICMFKSHPLEDGRAKMRILPICWIRLTAYTQLHP